MLQRLGSSLVKMTDSCSLKEATWFVTPRMFGAKGDGVTDDTTSLQAMMDYATLYGKACVFDEAGTYLTMRPLIYKQKGFRNCRLLCFGGRAVIKFNSKSTSGLSPDIGGEVLDVNAAIVVTPDNPNTAVRNQPQSVYIDGLQFTTDVGAEYAVYLGRTQNTNIMNIRCTGFSKSDIRDLGSWVMRITGCELFSACEYNFYKSAGTSTHLDKCYFQNGQYGVRLRSGYSSITGGACDFTKRAAFWLESSDYNSVYSIDRCGFENSGEDAVIKISGRVGLTWSNTMAGNIDSSQSPTPNNLIWIQADSNGSQITMSNIRSLGIRTRRIYDLGQNTRFTINNVNITDGTKPDVLGAGAKVVETDYNTTRFSSASNTTGLTVGADGIADALSHGNKGGSLPNDQAFLRYTKTITRQGSNSFGQITLTLPFELDAEGEGYQVLVTPQVYPNNVATEKWVTSFYNRQSNSVVITAGRGDGDTSWGSVVVSILIVGKRK